jgi:hypothetical protein
MTGSRLRGRPREHLDSLRRHSALDIRQWVEDRAIDPEQLRRALQRKINLIDRAMRRALGPLGEDLAPPRECPSNFTPQAVALYAVPCARLRTPEARRLGVGFAIIGDYWARQPYRGRLLPRMVWSLEPQELCSPARIHVLDLPPKLLRRALTRSPVVAACRAGGRPAQGFAELAWPELEQEAAAAASFVALEPIASSESPYLMGLRRELLRRSHDEDQDDEARGKARDLMTDLDGGRRGFQPGPRPRCRGTSGPVGPL